MTAKRTLKRDTLKALERAAMRLDAISGDFTSYKEKCLCASCWMIRKRMKEFHEACAAQSQAGGKRRKRDD